MNASEMRKFWLVVTIALYVAMQVFWALAGHWGFFWCFVTILIAVLVWEVINNFWMYGKTLSTEVTHKIKEGGKRRAFLYAAITLMVASMTALAFHLGWV
jgi:hypothetical protein